MKTELPDDLKTLSAREIKDIRKIPLLGFIPNLKDEDSMKKEIKILVGRDLVKYVPGLKWMERFLSKYISHQYNDLVK